MISAESRKLIVTSLFIVICTIHTKYLYSVLAVFDYIWNITTHSICINVFIFRHVRNNNNYWILWWFFLRIWWLYIVINTLAVNIDHNHAHHSHNGLTKKYFFLFCLEVFPLFFCPWFCVSLHMPLRWKSCLWGQIWGFSSLYKSILRNTGIHMQTFFSFYTFVSLIKNSSLFVLSIIKIEILDYSDISVISSAVILTTL